MKMPRSACGGSLDQWARPYVEKRRPPPRCNLGALTRSSTSKTSTSPAAGRISAPRTTRALPPTKPPSRRSQTPRQTLARRQGSADMTPRVSSRSSVPAEWATLTIVDRWWRPPPVPETGHAKGPSEAQGDSMRGPKATRPCWVYEQTLTLAASFLCRLARIPTHGAIATSAGN